jgi:phosphoglycolate phosphatase
MVKAVLFDLDGVLIDSGPAWHRVIGRGRREWGYPPIDRETFGKTFGQGVEADRRQFFPRETVERIAAHYQRAFAEEIAAVALCDGAIDVLVELGRRGLLRAVVTNTPVDLARRLLAQKGLLSHLDAWAAAGEAREKPAPDLVRLALVRLGVAADQAIYVGDSQSDRLAARAAGVLMAGLGVEGDLRLASLRDVLALIER